MLPSRQPRLLLLALALTFLLAVPRPSPSPTPSSLPSPSSSTFGPSSTSAPSSTSDSSSTSALPPLYTAGSCSAWPGDTVHYYRGPRPTPRPIRPTPCPDPGLLAADPGAFAAGPPDLTGTWAQLQITGSLSQAPLLGEIRATTRTLYRLVLTQTGTALAGTAEVCDLRVDSEGLDTHIPPAFIAAIPVSPRTGRLEPSASGYAFHLDRQLTVLGAHLAHPESDPLPTEEDDPAMVDGDNDGHPGMTIELGGMLSGQIYVVQRVARALDGAAINPDRIDGYIDWSIEQVTVDASTFMLETDTHPSPDPAPERSTFRSVRIDPLWQCPEVAQHQDVLFPS